MLCLQLHVVCNTVTRVQSAILVRLVADLQQTVHFLLIDTHTSCNLSQALVCVIPCLVHHIRIEEILLLLEKLLAEVVELVGLHLEHGKPCLVYECRGRVPGLNLLAEDGNDAIRVLLEEGFAQRRAVDGLEELGAEGADVVQVWRWSVYHQSELDYVLRDVQISMVWTTLGWMAVEASFCPANLGARAILEIIQVN
jgi:hypothetical protein